MPEQAHYSRTLSFESACEQFSLMARVDGRSRRTLEFYQYVFNSFAQFIGQAELQELDALAIRRYLGSLQDRGLKPNTVAIHRRVLRALFNWLRRWLKARGIADLDHVFIDRKGEPIKKRWVEQIVSRLGAKAKASPVDRLLG